MSTYQSFDKEISQGYRNKLLVDFIFQELNIHLWGLLTFLK